MQESDPTSPYWSPNWTMSDNSWPLTTDQFLPGLQKQLVDITKEGWESKGEVKAIQNHIVNALTVPADMAISDNSSFCQKHLGVPDSSDGSDGTSYPLTENHMLPVAQATDRVA